MKIGNISGIYPNGYALKNTKNNLQNNKVEYSNANFLNKNASDAIKNNAVAMINFRGNNSKEIDKIVQKLKEYGIDAEFTNLPTAQLTLDAVEDFIKLNDKDIFKGLKIIPYKEDIDWIWGSSFNCDTHEYVIKLNNNFSMEEFQEYSQKQYDSCFISSNNPKHDFYDVLGQFLCFQYNPYAYMRNCNQKSFSESFLKVARKIGDNSTDNFSRFNGMYIAARMCGVEVPPNSRKFYIENVGAELNFPPAKITKNPFEKRHDFSSVEEASEYLKQYGIEAEFSKLKLANLVVDSIEDFIQINNNPDMFRGLVIKKNTNDGIHTFGSVSWKYSYLESKILDCYLSFNEAYDFERHKNTAWRNYFSGHYASASEKYSIYHELGHWLDLQSRPEEYARSNDAFARNEKYVNEIGKRRFGKVSAYAQKSPQEFIAEYIAARMCGLEFPEEVNKEIEYYTPLRLKFPTVNQ